MLEKMLEKYRVVDSVGNKVGKLKDIYLNLDTWKGTAFEYSPGALKKDKVFTVSQIDRMDHDKGTIILKDKFEDMDPPEKTKREMYPFKEIQKLQVVDSMGEKVGKVYNIDIPVEKLKDFKVWKLLIRVGIKDRRLRISPQEISEIMGVIKLKKTLEQYKEELE